MYCEDAERPVLLYEVVAPEVMVVASVVPEGSDKLAGATPSVTLVVVGLVLSMRRKMMYPLLVAPAPGKVAAVQLKSICEEPFAAAANEVAAAVGSLESV